MALNSKLKNNKGERPRQVRKRFFSTFNGMVFLDFEYGAWHFHFALGPTNYIAGYIYIAKLCNRLNGVPQNSMSMY